MSNPQTFQRKTRKYVLYQMQAGGMMLSQWLLLQIVRGWSLSLEGVDVRGSFSSAGIYLRLYATVFHRSHIYYHISQREARKQPDLWTDFRPNKHALRVWGWLRHPRNSQVTGCEMDRSRRHLSREDRFSSGWRPTLVIVKEGKMCEHRSINRHWWAGKINSIPPRAGFRNLSAALWASKKFLAYYT